MTPELKLYEVWKRETNALVPLDDSIEREPLQVLAVDPEEALRLVRKHLGQSSLYEPSMVRLVSERVLLPERVKVL